MKKLLLITTLCILACGTCFADEIYVIETDANAPSIMDTIETKTSETAQKTGAFVKENAIKAGNATKKGACKAGKATKREAIKAGKAAKKGAKKATNWSAKKIEQGAQKVIEKTQDTTVNSPEQDTNAEE